MVELWRLLAIVAVSVATVVAGVWGLRVSRSASELYVASRKVRSRLNANAIAGEYLSGASFLGIAGLIMLDGGAALWYPIGWTAGFLVLLVLIAAPLRRSGAYTVPDFADARLDSLATRRLSALLIVAIGSTYLIAQFQGAGIVMNHATGADHWVGSALVIVVVLFNVLFAGMRSVTFAQAFQYWLKLFCLMAPLILLALLWTGTHGDIVGHTIPSLTDWASPNDGDRFGWYQTLSVITATFLGVVGLPHITVRFYTNPDGHSARRSTTFVLALLALFYLLPMFYAGFGLEYVPHLATGSGADAVVLALPDRMAPPSVSIVLEALLYAGAFAAFVSTSSGVCVAMAGVLGYDILTARFAKTTAFRIAAVLAIAIPFALALAFHGPSVATLVGMAFTLAAATFFPLLTLGIWWCKLTDVGAILGLIVGGLSTGSAMAMTARGGPPTGWDDALLSGPAPWCVPLTFAVMIVGSLLSAGRRPANADSFMMRIHTPEGILGSGR